MKIHPLAVLVVTMGAIAMWVVLRPGGGEPTNRSALPAESASGAESSQTDPELRRAARLGPVAREAIDKEDPEAAVEVPGLGEDSEGAVLVVITLDRATGDPVANVRLVLCRDPIDIWPCSVSLVDGSVGNLDRAPVTDEEGRAMFSLPAGVPSRIDARGEADRVGVSTLYVPALAPGERRSVAVDLQVGYDLPFFGRVQAAEGGGPVSGAEVHFQTVHRIVNDAGAGQDVFETHVGTHTGSDGLFEALLPSWLELTGRVEASGFGPGFFSAGGSHQDPAHALRIELEPGAAVRGTVQAQTRADVDGCVVRVEAYGNEVGAALGTPSWATTLAVDGTWGLRDLPSETWLSLELRSPDGRILRHVGVVVLHAGEERVFDWRLGSGASLHGRILLAGGGEPVGGHEIWLVPGYESEESSCFFGIRWPLARTHSDEAGGFRFEDVGPGWWRIGPAPPVPGEAPSVAGRTKTVEVSEGTSELEIVLDAWRGLFIRGIVFDPFGEPAPGASVRGAPLGGWWPPSVETGVNGAFTLGPLLPGTYSVNAGDFDYAAAEAVDAEAGVEGVRLRLRLGGALSGRVVEASTGSLHAADLSVYRTDGTGDLLGYCDGDFSFVGLEPGTYAITATSGDLAGSISGVVVDPGETAEGLLIPLTRGASLSLDYRGASAWIRYVVLLEGHTVAGDGIGFGYSADLVLPPGEVTVKFFAWGDDEATEVVEGELSIVLVPGEEAELVWPPTDEGE